MNFVPRTTRAISRLMRCWTRPSSPRLRWSVARPTATTIASRFRTSYY